MGAAATDMSTKLNFAPDCESFLKEVRNDAAPKGWALLTYADGSMENIVTVAKGDGNADELATHLDDEKIMFALVRVTEKIDNSTTIKFAHIHFTGPNAKRKHYCSATNRPCMLCRVFAVSSFELVSCSDAVIFYVFSSIIRLEPHSYTTHALVTARLVCRHACCASVGAFGLDQGVLRAVPRRDQGERQERGVGGDRRRDGRHHERPEDTRARQNDSGKGAS
jgi:hypothetical protein